MRLHDLTGRNVVITGAAGGIGSASAAAFTACGANVVLMDSSAEGLARASQQLARPPVLTLAHDASDPPSVTAAFAQVEREWTCVDVLINAVGVAGRGRISETSDAMWRRAIDVNLSAVFYSCREALPLLRASSRGTIVNLASIAGLREQPGSLAYSAAKGGLVMFSRSLAADLAREGIRVHAVCPTAVDTAMLDDFFSAFADPEQARQDYEAAQPMGRMITVEEVADVIVDLCITPRPYTPEPFVV
jgi:NAD(P)-dependent dehydrogenase (short-subunit alcohol dehydrogenase family)